MNGASLRIGKISGIGIYLHFSWLIIFAIVTLSLGNFYSATFPQWLQIEHWLFAIMTSLLFFTSVLVHELAHSVVARHKGIPVSSITLFIFGGVASIEREAERPKDEFQIAVAGPLMSLVISLSCFLISWLSSDAIEQLAAMTAWLSAINLGLAIFNLLPGFPMDGGRILRSLIWWYTGDLTRATHIVGWLSRAVALAFIVGGCALLIFGNEIFSGIWLAFIGWFLYTAAQSSVRQHEFYEVMHGLRAQDVMEANFSRVSDDVNVLEFAEYYLMRTDRRCFVVTQDDRVHGLITQHHIKMLPRELWAEVKISRIMTRFDELLYVKPDTLIETIFDQMIARHMPFALVINNNEILGLVTQDKLMNSIATKLEEVEKDHKLDKAA